MNEKNLIKFSISNYIVFILILAIHFAIFFKYDLYYYFYKDGELDYAHYYDLPFKDRLMEYVFGIVIWAVYFFSYFTVIPMEIV